MPFGDLLGLQALAELIGAPRVNPGLASVHKCTCTARAAPIIPLNWFLTRCPRRIQKRLDAQGPGAKLPQVQVMEKGFNGFSEVSALRPKRERC